MPLIVYEQPLNERVRTFLRIEHLFQLANHYDHGDSYWDSRICLSTLLDLLELLSRSDIKSELIKELERHATTLDTLKANPGVDLHRLETVLADINRYIDQLRSKNCQPGAVLKGDEMAIAVRQRNAIPGGTCNFDLPVFHYWLHRDTKQRDGDIAGFLEDLLIIRHGIELALNMIRNSSTATEEQAVAGFFQRAIEPNVACQMIRVSLADDVRYYPEISAGRHRFTVRFMEQTATRDRPQQTQQNVGFQLHCCIL